MAQQPANFWSRPSEEVLSALESTGRGLSPEEAEKRLKEYGPNSLRPEKQSTTLKLFISQFKSPIIILLIFAAALSSFLGDRASTLIILVIIAISGFLGFWQEKGASNAVKKLLAIVRIKAAVLRNGHEAEIAVELVVPGDIVVLNAGDVIPGDCLILKSKDLFVDEAALTGETYQVEKMAGVLPADTPLASRKNSVFMGTHVVNGSAEALVVNTGLRTEFGKVSARLSLAPPETEFERGVRRFGYLLIELTLVLVIAIFGINVYLERPVLESFLFALALAVGLTPQLLPAIISVNLAQGAQRMAREKVIVKRLGSIENFGSMNILCSDKTGTLTEGVVSLHYGLDLQEKENEKVALYGYLNAFFESGFVDPIDAAIRNAHKELDISRYNKLDEVPYDFVRKRLSILVNKDGRTLMITKGALKNVLQICTHAERAAGSKVRIAEVEKRIMEIFEKLSKEGFRTLGIAYREMDSTPEISREQEKDMVFLGFLAFYDPPKPEVSAVIKELNHMGVTLKIITGDNRVVAEHVCEQVNLSPKTITGSDLHSMSDEALLKQSETVSLFAEVEPNQKERIILALRKAGNVVGYMGDGINDASALQAADVGISVDSAVDVAKEAADFVLLEKNLDVLAKGIEEGRKTFANTLKYVFMAISANFGNMFSMAGASLFLPFLPLLPTQILLVNLLTDFPEMTIGTDTVDREWTEHPKRWDISFIRKFMITFGIISSVFDFLTFGTLLLLVRATPELFRTGWFIESVVSASLVVLILRTKRPFFKSMPGRYLFFATLATVTAAFLLPFTPMARLFHFRPLPWVLLAVIVIIIVLYMVTAELAKQAFYKRVRF